jgi:hypothetical protein
MRKTAKLAASAFAVVASVLVVGCAGDQDARRANQPVGAPTTETTRFGTESYTSPSSDNKGFGDQERRRPGDYYGSERGAKSPGGDVSPSGGKTPGGDVAPRPDNDVGTPDTRPGIPPCPGIPPGAGHGSSGIKPGSMSGDDNRTTDCPDWQESDHAKPGGRGTIQ